MKVLYLQLESLLELVELAGKFSLSPLPLQVANNLIGTRTECMIVANDATVKGGSYHPVTGLFYFLQVSISYKGSNSILTQ